MAAQQRSKETGGDKVFKGSPAPTPDQAVESGEPTLTGDATDKKRPDTMPGEPKEGAHWEEGKKQ